MSERPYSPLRFGRLLLTGAAGHLGQQMRPRLKDYCESLRVSDLSDTLGPAGAGMVHLYEGARRHGARRIYVPAMDKSVRDAAIRAKFNGQNAAECCREFGISRTSLYRIVGRRAPA